MKNLLLYIKYFIILSAFMVVMPVCAPAKGYAESYDFSDFEGKSIGVLTGSVQEKQIKMNQQKPPQSD